MTCDTNETKARSQGHISSGEPSGKTGGQRSKGITNFITMLYFSAPTKQAALNEFQRWAELRLADIPSIVLEQVSVEDIPRCPQPCFDQYGEAMEGFGNR